MSETNVERRLSAALKCHKHRIPDFLVRTVQMDIDHDELSLALEILVDAIIEDQHALSVDEHSSLRLLITELSSYPRQHLVLLKKYCPVLEG